jgi:hypothetical protein
MSNGFIYSIYKTKKTNDLALSIIDEKLYYWYQNTDLIDIWLKSDNTISFDDEMEFICYVTPKGCHMNLFNIIINMKDKSIKYFDKYLNYQNIKDEVYKMVNMWNFEDYDKDEQEYETFDYDNNEYDTELEEENIEKLNKLECFSPEFIKRKCDDAEKKLKYLKLLCLYGSNKTYYNNKFITQQIRKLKNTDSNFKHIRYNFYVNNIYYSKGESFQYTKEISLLGKAKGCHAKFYYERTEGDEKSGHYINKSYDCDFIEEDVRLFLFRFLNKKINWDIYLYKDDDDNSIYDKIECPVYDDDE